MCLFMLDTFYDLTYEEGLGLVRLFQGTYVTVGAYIRLEPPWRALLFTHCGIESPTSRQWLIPSSLSSHFNPSFSRNPSNAISSLYFISMEKVMDSHFWIF